MRLTTLLIILLPCMLAVNKCSAVPTEQTLTTVDWHQPLWTKTLREEIAYSKDLFAQAEDISIWCPNYSQIPLIDFWTQLFIEVSYFESEFNPKAYYMESSGVPSLGLFQLSTPDEMPWCNHETDTDLYEPINNIRCAVPLMAGLIAKDKMITAGDNNKTARGAARYWATMRGGTYPGHTVDKIRLAMRGFCDGYTNASGH